MANAFVCYTIGLNYVSSSNQYFPCGASNGTSTGAQACCYAGDFCMEDGICHYTHAVTNGTGYYMAGCTDPTWQDPSCPKQCTSEYGADVIYDTTNKHWNCCQSTDHSLDCQSPSDFTVDAPQPDALAIVKQLDTAVPSPALVTGIGVISSVGSVISLSSTPTTTASSTSSTSSISSIAASTTTADSGTFATQAGVGGETSAAATPSASSSASAGLSAGAKAGIAVGAVLAIFLLAAGAFFLFRRHKAARSRANGYGAVELPEKSPAVYAHYGHPEDEMQRRQTYVSSHYALSELPLSPPVSNAFGSDMDKPPGWVSQQVHEMSADLRQPQESPGSKPV